MAGCTCENWTLEDLSSALRDMHKDNKKMLPSCFNVVSDGKKDKNRNL